MNDPAEEQGAQTSGGDARVLVFAPFGKDSLLIEQILREGEIAVGVVGNAQELAADVPEQGSAAIVTEEALSPKTIAALAEKIAQQPPWSDFPFIVLTGSGVSTAGTELAVRSRAPLGNVSLLERPLRPATLLSAVRTALAARQRQYEVRNHLEERKRSEEELRRSYDALEDLVEQRTSALRLLSARLLRVQDDERRRVARDLHDGLGQYLVALKMNVDMLSAAEPEMSTEMREVQQLLERAISETRTISHLLHPPLLDEAGFASAAQWYVAGFGKRSGIKATLSMPGELGRFAPETETALFRILQEALTNVHRHSESPAVEAALTIGGDSVTLTIRDFGVGIPGEVLNKVVKSGTEGGVGLAGIRERIRELGGRLDIRSSRKGTTLTAVLPSNPAPCADAGVAPPLPDASGAPASPGPLDKSASAGRS